MKSLEDQMSVYSAYHLDRRNRATHFVGVPMIMVGLLVALSGAGVDIPLGGNTVRVTGAHSLALVVLVYYLRLDAVIGLAMVAITSLMLWAAAAIARLEFKLALAWFLLLFAGGWVIQLVGHVFEGRKPALADNLFQIFIAPLFLCAEVFFALGWRPALQSAVLERARRLRAGSGELNRSTSA